MTNLAGKWLLFQRREAHLIHHSTCLSNRHCVIGFFELVVMARYIHSETSKQVFEIELFPLQSAKIIDMLS
jgi:hypothetical protein